MAKFAHCVKEAREREERRGEQCENNLVKMAEDLCKDTRCTLPGQVILNECKLDLVIEDPQHWAVNAMGRCDYKLGYISVSNQLPEDIQSSILLHELLHMIAEMNSIELSEQSIDGLSLGLLSFIKNNPEIINFIQNSGGNTNE